MRSLLTLSILALSACASSQGATERPTTVDNARVIGLSGTTTLSTVLPESPEVANVQAPPDSVWRVLPAVFQTLGIPVTTVDATNRMIGNSSHKVRRKLGPVALSKYLDCGTTQSAPSADTYEVQLSVMSRVSPSAGPNATPGTTAVMTSVEALAKPVSFAGDNVRCASTGALEARLAQLIAIELKQ